jgi:hypothetical protein
LIAFSKSTSSAAVKNALENPSAEVGDVMNDVLSTTPADSVAIIRRREDPVCVPFSALELFSTEWPSRGKKFGKAPVPGQNSVSRRRNISPGSSAYPIVSYNSLKGH